VRDTPSRQRAQGVIKRRECSLLNSLSDFLGSGLLGTTLLGVKLLAHEFTNCEGSLLSVDHDTEAAHIVEIGAFRLDVQLTCSVSLGPLFGNLVIFPAFLNCSGSGSTVKGNFDFGKLKSAEGVQDAGEFVALNEDALVIAPVNNHNGAAVIFTVVNESESAGLNKRSKRLKKVEG
jgi:hypothetical protein